MKLDVQVAIVGGGPAGTAAAISARQYGLSVVLIEQQLFPRHRPGESLHPGIEPLLLQLGVARAWLDGYARFNGHWQQANGCGQFQPFGCDHDGPWRGFHIPRDQLDQKLLAIATAQGATILQPYKACAISECDGGYQIRAVSSDVAPVDITAAVVIDASGASHWISRQFKHAVVPYSQPLYARYGYVSRAGAAAEYDEACFSATHSAWLWLAPINDEQLHWTQLEFNGSPADTSLINHEKERSPGDRSLNYRPSKQLPAALKAANTLGPIRGADVTWRKSEPCAGGRYFKVGDAGFVLDPASSHGVLKALMSGIFAAHVSRQLLVGQASAEQVRVCFQAWMDQHFFSDKQALTDFYASLTVC